MLINCPTFLIRDVSKNTEQQKLQMKFKLIKGNYSDIKENLNFYVALTLSFLTSLFLILHPTSIETFNELGNLKWIMVLSGIIGLTILVFLGIFGYIFLTVYSIKALIKKLKENRILSAIGTVFQFLFIVAMTWPIPMLVIRPLAKLYFDITIPNLL